MPNVTLAVPPELKERMDRFREINWSEVARQAFAQKLADLELVERFKERSELTEEDALRLGRELRERVARHYK